LLELKCSIDVYASIWQTIVNVFRRPLEITIMHSSQMSVYAYLKTLITANRFPCDTRTTLNRGSTRPTDSGGSAPLGEPISPRKGAQDIGGERNSTRRIATISRAAVQMIFGKSAGYRQLPAGRPSSCVGEFVSLPGTRVPEAQPHRQSWRGPQCVWAANSLAACRGFWFGQPYAGALSVLGDEFDPSISQNLLDHGNRFLVPGIATDLNIRNRVPVKAGRFCEIPHGPI
jgi:hypothetical protein